MALAATPLLAVTPFYDGLFQTSHDTEPWRAVTGEVLGETHLVPPLAVRLHVQRLRTTRPSRPEADVLRGAADRFEAGTVAGLTPDDHCRLAAQSTGVPITVAYGGLRGIAEHLRALPAVVAPYVERARDEVDEDASRPAFDVRWHRRGDVLGVVAPGNHPMPHTAWLEAFALGYRVAVRPATRDALTPTRLLGALVDAGADPRALGLLPGGHTAATALVEMADRALVYGGDAAVQRWRGTAHVAVRGPGRTKALLDRPARTRELDALVAGIAADGGVRCTNVSTVLAAGDHHELATRLAAALARLPALPAVHPDAALPAFSPSDARRLGDHVALLTSDAVDHTVATGPERVVPLGDGSCTVAPTVLAVDRPDHPLTAVELPFPFVVVAPWRPVDGIGPLRGSLVAVLMTDDDDLVDAAVGDPAIAKVVHGTAMPWETRPGLPHDGSLPDFLLAPKTLVRGLP